MEIAENTGFFDPFAGLSEKTADSVKLVMLVTRDPNAPIDPEPGILEDLGPKACRRVAVSGSEVAEDGKLVRRIKIP